MSDDIDPNNPIQYVNYSDNDLKFVSPCAIGISGPSQCGKSSFIVKLIENRKMLFTQNFERLYYCQPSNLCTINNPIFEEILKLFPTAEMICGLPNLTKLNLNSDTTSKCLIVDDLMSSFLNSPEMLNLLSVEIHHSNITLLSLHNVYENSRHGITVSRNTHYKVFFYNRLDLRELRFISVQLGLSANFLQDCFNFLMKTFSENPYVLVDGHYLSKMKALHIRSHIFPFNGTFQPIIFLPDKSAS